MTLAYKYTHYRKWHFDCSLCFVWALCPDRFSWTRFNPNHSRNTKLAVDICHTEAGGKWAKQNVKCNTIRFQKGNDTYLDTAKQGVRGQENCLGQKINWSQFKVGDRCQIFSTLSCFYVCVLEKILACCLLLSAPHMYYNQCFSASALPRLCKDWLAPMEITRYAIFKYVKSCLRNMIMIRES